MDRIEALTAVVNDSSRSEIDREIARRALADLSPANHDQERQDHDIELWFAPRTERCTGRDKMDARKGFDGRTKQLLDDLCDCHHLGLPPTDGVEERLEALFTRTKSEIVRQHVVEALKSIAWHRDRKVAAA